MNFNMSFSSDVKEELSGVYPTARHCQLAELLAIFHFNGQLMPFGKSKYIVKFQIENLLLAKKVFSLLKNVFNINADVLVRKAANGKGRSLYLYLQKQEDVKSFVGALKLNKSRAEAVSMLTGRKCCARAYLRGAFLSAGSISDPQNSYHFEVVCSSFGEAEILQSVINSFEVDMPLVSKITQRKGHYLVYIKESSQIVDLLNLMNAHKSLMEMENLRALKEFRNDINRRVNCEAANINKTVQAAYKQKEDILYVKEHGGYARLKESVVELAELRLEMGDASLKELGELLDPPVGKSGVNHRLKKISELAEIMRREALLKK